MYGKYEYLNELDTLYHYFHTEVPSKLEPGNPSYELAYSLTGILDYFTQIGNRGENIREQLTAAFDQITKQENALGERLLSYLRNRPDCRIIGKEKGSDDERVPTISFIIKNKDSGEIARRMEKYKIAIRYGDFYARRLIEYLELTGHSGVVRVSMVHYNTLEEVDALIAGLEEVLAEN
jgi:selenocysteine lyase/cysteine desulfurase